MKHLKVEYNGVVLFDGEVDEVVWSDGASGVNVSGKFKRPERQGGGGNAASFFEKIAAASKAKTAEAVELGRADLNSEQAPEVPQP